MRQWSYELAIDKKTWMAKVTIWVPLPQQSSMKIFISQMAPKNKWSHLPAGFIKNKDTNQELPFPQSFAVLSASKRCCCLSMLIMTCSDWRCNLQLLLASHDVVVLWQIYYLIYKPRSDRLSQAIKNEPIKYDFRYILCNDCKKAIQRKHKGCSKKFYNFLWTFTGVGPVISSAHLFLFFLSLKWTSHRSRKIKLMIGEYGPSISIQRLTI